MSDTAYQTLQEKLAELVSKARSGAVVGGAIAGMLLTLLAGGKLNDVLHPTPSRTDLQAVQDTLRAELVQSLEGLAELSAHKALRQYDDSLRSVADQITQEVAIPTLDRLMHMSEELQEHRTRLQVVEQMVGVTQRTVQQDSQVLRDMRATTNASAGQNEELHALLMRVMQELEEIKQREGAPTPAEDHRKPTPRARY